jgi:hypothetical protein
MTCEFVENSSISQRSEGIDGGIKKTALCKAGVFCGRFFCVLLFTGTYIEECVHKDDIHIQTMTLGCA